MLRAVDPCRSQCRLMAHDFGVARPQQCELFSWSGPRKQGVLLAIEKPRREIGMVIFQRGTVIGGSLVFSCISFNKPAITRLVAKKRANEIVFGRSQTAHGSLTYRFEKRSCGYATAGAGKLSKRKPKIISRTPSITAYQAMIQISAAAPAIGFHKRRPAKMIEARPIRIRNHSPLISRRILIASAISVAPIIKAQAAM